MYWQRFRSWSPSDKISGSMTGTMPCYAANKAHVVRTVKTPTTTKSCREETCTCWQILEYRARTFAFSLIASWDGLVSLTLRTQRHFAKMAPSFLYCMQRSAKPSRPVEDVKTVCKASYSVDPDDWNSSNEQMWWCLTLCGGFTTRSCQGDNTLVNLRNKS